MKMSRGVLARSSAYKGEHEMKKLHYLSLALSLFATTVCAEDYDGSAPMVCVVLESHDCLPNQKACEPLEPETVKDMNLHIDVPNMTVKLVKSPN